MFYVVCINYSYKGCYLLILSSCWDGLFILVDGNKWDMFFVGVIVWCISDEFFMQNVKVVFNLKLCVSYGVIGNVGVLEYVILDYSCIGIIGF